MCLMGIVSWGGIADAQIFYLFIFNQLASHLFLSGGMWYYVSGADHLELSCWVLCKPLDRKSSSVADPFSFFPLSPSDHSGVQLFHIHSLHPAGLGEAGR